MIQSQQQSRASVPPPPQKNEVDPWLIWVTFRRNWMWALPVGVMIAGIASFLVINSFVPRFRASYILMANDQFVAYQGVVPVLRNLSKSERTLIYNPIVLDPVLQDSENRSAPSLSDPSTDEANLIKNLKVRSAGTDSTLEISYEDSDAEAAAMVCNAIVDSYLRLRNRIDNQRTVQLQQLLEPEIRKWEGRVEVYKKSVEKLSKDLGGQPSVEGEDLKILAELRADIAELKYQITVDAVTEKQLAEEEARRIANASTPLQSTPIEEAKVERFIPTEYEIDREAQAHEEVVYANEKIAHYDSEIMRIEDNPNQFGGRRDEYRKKLQANKANLQKWKDYLQKAEVVARQAAEAKLEALADRDYKLRLARAKAMAEAAQDDTQAQIAAQEAKIREELALKQAERDDRKVRLKIREQHLLDEQRKIEQRGSVSAEFIFAQDDYAVANEVLGKLRTRDAEIRTESARNGSVLPMAPATKPRFPIEPVPYKMLALVCIASLLFPFAVGFLWEFRTQRLTDSTMCDKKGLSVIGEIAQLPSGSRARKGRRVFEESVDTLRASLFMSIDTRSTRSIAVVSSMSGEGKSSVSSQLALSIAKATGETVLLIDGDMRCPDQHDIFGLEIGPGLSGVLSEKVSLNEAINRSLGDRIHVLPAGPLSGSPHRLLSPQKMETLIDEALKEYKYVVVDTAPVLSAGESLAVASAVDATLLCVMRDLSRMENVTRTTRRLEAVGATLAGTVFSGVTARQYAYRYGDYHYATPEANVPNIS